MRLSRCGRQHGTAHQAQVSDPFRAIEANVSATSIKELLWSGHSRTPTCDYYHFRKLASEHVNYTNCIGNAFCYGARDTNGMGQEVLDRRLNLVNCFGGKQPGTISVASQHFEQHQDAIKVAEKYSGKAILKPSA